MEGKLKLSKKQVDLIRLNAQTKEIFGVARIHPIYRIFPHEVKVEIIQLTYGKKGLRERKIVNSIQSIRLYYESDEKNG